MNEVEKNSAIATSGSRIMAALIDYVIHGITIGILILVTWPFIGYENIYQSLLDYVMDGTITDTYVAYSIMSVVSAFISGFIYYGVIPTNTKGQTIGKKMFHIKAIKEDGTPPGLGTNLLRAVMLYGMYFNALFLLTLLFDDYTLYETLSTPFNFVASLVVFISLIMILSRSDRRGIHDLIGKTYVIMEGSGLSSEPRKSKPKKEDPFEFDYDSLEEE